MSKNRSGKTVPYRKSIFVGESIIFFLHQTRVSAEQHNQKSTSTYRTNRNAPILRLERSTTSPTNLCAFCLHVTILLLLNFFFFDELIIFYNCY